MLFERLARLLGNILSLLRALLDAPLILFQVPSHIFRLLAELLNIIGASKIEEKEKEEYSDNYTQE